MPSDRNTNPFNKIRCAWYFRPLAILLPLLLFGDFPRLPQLSLVPKAVAGINACIPPGPPNLSKIVQTCDAPPSLEANALAAFLQAHSIPTSEANLIFQYGRKDVRSELRALIYSNLVAIIKKAPSLRTADEQAAYDWIQNKVWQHQIDQYTAAVQDRDLWKSSPCRWRPDPDVASQFNLTWDGSVWCNVADNLGAVFAGGSFGDYPTKDYFLTAALKNTYGNRISTTVGAADILARMQGDMGTAIGVAVGTGLGITATLLGGFSIWLAAGGGYHVGTSYLIAILGGGVNETSLSPSAFISGPFLVVTLAAIVGSIAAFQLYNEQTALQGLATLDSDLSWNKSNKPNLEAFVDDPIGAYKVQLSFAENTVPDFPSTAVPPGRRSGDRNFIITPQGGTSFNSPTFSYLDWAKTKWTAGPSGGWISAQGVTKDNSTDYNFGVSIHFLDWNGRQYTASRNGVHFTVNKLAASNGDTVCPPDSSGNTPGDVSKCSIFMTDTLTLQDSNGNKASVRLSGDPLFTSRDSFALTKSGGTVNITADGIPVPAISLTSSLPAGFSFVAGAPGSAQIIDNGSAADGTYTFTLSASDGAKSLTQDVTIVIAETVKIIGTPDTSVFGGKRQDYYVQLGRPSSITVAVGGSPTPALTCSSHQGAMTLTDNGDGTGTFLVNYPGLTRDQYNQGNYIGQWCRLTADNQLTSDSATINFFPILGPGAAINSSTTATFADNIPYQLPVTATAPAGSKIAFSFPCTGNSPYAPPNWLQLKDNGDGTAVLSGQPPALGSSWQFALFASVGETGVCGVPNFTINVKHIPTLPGQMSYSVTAGTPVNVITGGVLTGGNGSVSGTQPPGLQLTAGARSTWTLTGTAPNGSGGEYDLLYTVTNSDASVSGIFKLFVLEAPQFIIPDSAIFQIGLDNSFAVTTTGFPKNSIVPAAVSGTAGPMRISIQGNLPPGVTFSDQDLLGNPTGTGVLSGKPAAGTRGLYPLTFTSENGVGSKAIQNFNLQVSLPGDVNNDGIVNCTDVNIIGDAYGSYRGNPKYALRADLSSDGLISSADLAVIGKYMPAGLSCPFNPPTIVDVSNRVKVVQGGFGRNRATGLWSGTMTITNTSSAPINGPIQVILMNLTSGVTMQNNTGYTTVVLNTGAQNGYPYITALPTGTLAPGASLSLMIQFQNPSNEFINFTPGAVSGTF